MSLLFDVGSTKGKRRLVRSERVIDGLCSDVHWGLHGKRTQIWVMMGRELSVIRATQAVMLLKDKEAL